MWDFRQKAELVAESLPSNFGHDETQVFTRTLEFWQKRFPQMNIEDFYVLAEVQQLLGVPNPITGARGGLADSVQYLIAKTLAARMRRGASASHDALVARLIADEENSRSAIITLNWDLAMDNAFHRRLGDGGVDYGCPRAANLESGTTARENAFPLFKLHGSLNWWYCDSCQHLFFQPQQKTAPGAWEGVRPSCNTPACNARGKEMQPLMVPPTSQKLVSSPQASILTDIWNQARETLLNATHVEIVGYSFPATDVQLKMFVLDALISNPTLEKITVITSRKFGSEKLRFEDHFGAIFQSMPPNIDLEFIYDGFEAWAQTG